MAQCDSISAHGNVADMQYMGVTHGDTYVTIPEQLSKSGRPPRLRNVPNLPMNFDAMPLPVELRTKIGLPWRNSRYGPPPPTQPCKVECGERSCEMKPQLPSMNPCLQFHPFCWTRLEKVNLSFSDISKNNENAQSEKLLEDAQTKKRAYCGKNNYSSIIPSVSISSTNNSFRYTDYFHNFCWNTKFKHTGGGEGIYSGKGTFKDTRPIGDSFSHHKNQKNRDMYKNINVSKCTVKTYDSHGLVSFPKKESETIDSIRSELKKCARNCKELTKDDLTKSKKQEDKTEAKDLSKKVTENSKEKDKTTAQTLKRKASISKKEDLEKKSVVTNAATQSCFRCQEACSCPVKENKKIGPDPKLITEKEIKPSEKNVSDRTNKSNRGKEKGPTGKATEIQKTTKMTDKTDQCYEIEIRKDFMANYCHGTNLDGVSKTINNMQFPFAMQCPTNPLKLQLRSLNNYSSPSKLKNQSDLKIPMIDYKQYPYSSSASKRFGTSHLYSMMQSQKVRSDKNLDNIPGRNEEKSGAKDQENINDPCAFKKCNKITTTKPCNLCSMCSSQSGCKAKSEASKKGPQNKASRSTTSTPVKKRGSNVLGSMTNENIDKKTTSKHQFASKKKHQGLEKTQSAIRRSKSQGAASKLEQQNRKQSPNNLKKFEHSNSKSSFFTDSEGLCRKKYCQNPDTQVLRNWLSGQRLARMEKVLRESRNVSLYSFCVTTFKKDVPKDMFFLKSKDKNKALEEDFNELMKEKSYDFGSGKKDSEIIKNGDSKMHLKSRDQTQGKGENKTHAIGTSQDKTSNVINKKGSISSVENKHKMQNVKKSSNSSAPSDQPSKITKQNTLTCFRNPMTYQNCMSIGKKTKCSELTGNFEIKNPQYPFCNFHFLDKHSHKNDEKVASLSVKQSGHVQRSVSEKIKKPSNIKSEQTVLTNKSNKQSNENFEKIVTKETPNSQIEENKVEFKSSLQHPEEPISDKKEESEMHVTESKPESGDQNQEVSVGKSLEELECEKYRPKCSRPYTPKYTKETKSNHESKELVNQASSKSQARFDTPEAKTQKESQTSEVPNAHTPFNSVSTLYKTEAMQHQQTMNKTVPVPIVPGDIPMELTKKPLKIHKTGLDLLNEQSKLLEEVEIERLIRPKSEIILNNEVSSQRKSFLREIFSSITTVA